MAVTTESLIAAVDVGATSIKGGLVDSAGAVVNPVVVLTPSSDGPDAVIDTMTTVAGDLIALGRKQVGGVPAAGIVVPGIVDEANGTAVFSANLGWRNVPLRSLLERRLGLPIAFGHDVRAGGLAEALFGAARRVQDLIFVPIGTGIAAASLIGGELVTGSGYAGEFGHVVVDPDGAPCDCGGRGCLETIASARAIVRRYGERAGRELRDAEAMARLVAAKDRDAERVWNDAIQALADVLAPCAALLAPQTIVIGGGLSESGDLLLTPLRQALDVRLPCQRRPQIVQAQLGIWAGCVGAAILARDMYAAPSTAKGSSVR